MNAKEIMSTVDKMASQAELADRNARAHEYVARKTREKAERRARIIRKAFVLACGALMFGCLIAVILMTDIRG